MPDSPRIPCLLPSPVRLGWIGTGVMGESMCGHLLQAGYTLTVHTRTPSKAQGLLVQGAFWAESPDALIGKADVICTMVGFPKDVRAIYLGPNGLFAKARSGQVFVDFTTSRTRSGSRTLPNVANAQQVFALDAPVSGGDVGAKQGTLSIMVGGEDAVFDALTPNSFSVFGKVLVHQGGSGVRATFQNV